MKHVFWLRENVIGGRSGPNRNGWNPKELMSNGIGSVLSVNDGEMVHEDDLSAVGIRYSCVPLSDAAPPQPGDLEHCVASLPQALQFVLGEIGRGKCVLVHCTSGKDRTGLFLSYYLCKTEAMAPTDAIQAIRHVQPIALSATGWEDFALNVLNELAA